MNGLGDADQQAFVQHLMEEVNDLYAFLGEILGQLEAINPWTSTQAQHDLDGIIYKLKVRAR